MEILEIPFTPEQHLNAYQVEKLGLGIMIKPDDLNKSALREAVAQLFDAKFKDKVKEMQKIVREAGGYSYAVDPLQEYVKNQNSVTRELVKSNR